MQNQQTRNFLRASRFVLSPRKVLPFLFSGLALCTSARANVVFNFVESGGSVTMTYSGTLDTNGMTPQPDPPHQHNGTFIFDDQLTFIEHDVIGIAGTNTNTNSYLWTTAPLDFIIRQAGQEFVFLNPTPGSTPFMNSARNAAGVSLRSSDIDANGIWSGSGGATLAGPDFATLGLVPGRHFYTDAVSGESVIFNIGDVAEVTTDFSWFSPTPVLSDGTCLPDSPTDTFFTLSSSAINIQRNSSKTSLVVPGPTTSIITLSFSKPISSLSLTMEDYDRNGTTITEWMDTFSIMPASVSGDLVINGSRVDPTVDSSVGTLIWPALPAGTTSISYRHNRQAGLGVFFVRMTATTVPGPGGGSSQPVGLKPQLTGTQQRINDACLSDALNGYIVTNGGGIRVTADGGQTWTPLNSGVTNDLYSIRKVGSVLFIAGSNGLICRSTNGGTTWQQFTTGTGQTFRSLSFSSATRGFAVGNASTICLYNGTSWVVQNVGGVSTNFTSVQVVGNEAWAVGTGGVICLYNGTSWTDVSPPGVQNFDFRSVSFLNENLGFAVGTNGLLCRYNGSAWVQVDSGVTTVLTSVVAVDRNTICIVGEGGVVLESSDGGVTWQTQSVGSGAGLEVLVIREGRGYTFGGGGGGYSFSVPQVASGLTQVNTGTQQRINAAWFSGNSQYVCIATDNGGIQVSNDGGRTWTASNPGIPEDIKAVSQVGSKAFFAGENGVICVSTDGGVTWTAENTGGETATFRGLSFSSETRGFAVGFGTTICIYNGTSWVRQTVVGVATNFTGVSTVSGSSTAWAVGTGGVICRYNGTNWVDESPAVGGADFYSVSFLRENRGIAVGEGGLICLYNGSSWVRVNSGVSTTLRSVRIVDDNTVILTGDGGLVCQSYDGGRTWRTISVGTSQELLAIGYLNGRATVFGGGGVGAEFSVPRTPNGLAEVVTGTTNRINGSWFTGGYGCIATDNGQIRVTANGGQTWTTSTTGITTAIKAVSQVGTQSFLAGANGVICRSTNGGATWTPQSTGTTSVTFNALSFSSTTSGFAVGSGGTICIYNGTNWVAQATGTTAEFFGVSVGGGTPWAVGSGGVICVYLNNSWVPVSTGVTANFYGVNFLREDLGFAVGAGGVLCRYNGSRWVRVESGTTTALRSVLIVDERTVLVSGDGGLVCISTDGGLTWRLVSSGTSADLNTLSVSGLRAYAFGSGGAGVQFNIERLLAYWDFDNEDVPGENLISSSPNATLSNTAFLTPPGDGFSGRSGDCGLDLGGTNNQGRAFTPAGDHFDLIPQENAYTVTFWQLNRATNTSTSSFWFIAPASNNEQRGLQAHVPWSDGTIYFDQSGCCGGPQRLTAGGGRVTANQWQHYAFRRDANGNRDIFVDGVSVAQSAGAAPLADFSGVLSIGSNGSGVASLNGIIDEFAVFAGALDDAEIARLASGQRVLPSTAPLFLAVERNGAQLDLTWESQEGFVYNIRHSTNLVADEEGPAAWPIYLGNQNIEATPPLNTLTVPRSGPARYFAVEEIPAQP